MYSICIVFDMRPIDSMQKCHTETVLGRFNSTWTWNFWELQIGTSAKLSHVPKIEENTHPCYFNLFSWCYFNLFSRFWLSLSFEEFQEKDTLSPARLSSLSHQSRCSGWMFGWAPPQAMAEENQPSPFDRCSLLAIYSYMGVSINGGTPIAGWFITENTIKTGWWLGVPEMIWVMYGDMYSQIPWHVLKCLKHISPSRSIDIFSYVWQLEGSLTFLHSWCWISLM